MSKSERMERMKELSERLEAVLGNCEKELRRFNEVNLTLGHENPVTKEHRQLLMSCSKAMDERFEAIDAKCSQSRRDFHVCRVAALKAGDMTPCLEPYALFVQCAETAFANGL